MDEQKASRADTADSIDFSMESYINPQYREAKINADLSS